MQHQRPCHRFLHLLGGGDFSGDVRKLQHRQGGQSFRGVRLGLTGAEGVEGIDDLLGLFLAPAGLDLGQALRFFAPLFLSQGLAGQQAELSLMGIFQKGGAQKLLEPALLQLVPERGKQFPALEVLGRVPAVQPAVLALDGQHNPLGQTAVIPGAGGKLQPV